MTFGEDVVDDGRVGKADGGAEFERRMLGHGLGVLLDAAEAVVAVEDVVREGTDWDVLALALLELELGAPPSALREEEALDSSEPEERTVSLNAAWTTASNWGASGTVSDPGSVVLGPPGGNVCGSDMDGALGMGVDYSNLGEHEQMRRVLDAEQVRRGGGSSFWCKGADKE